MVVPSVSTDESREPEPTRVNLPTLPVGLFWNTTTLRTDGKIKVAATVYVNTPTFSPPAGNYIGAQSVTIGLLTGGGGH